MSDNWAKVELYRWQHGELPPDNEKDVKPLNVPEALRAGVKMMDTKDCPSVFNVAQVLSYVAKELEKETDDANQWMARCAALAAKVKALKGE
jgi:hypothetical protein